MAITFDDDKVSVICNSCEIFLVALAKANLTLAEALKFANQYKNPIFCKKCSEVPKEVPEVLH